MVGLLQIFPGLQILAGMFGMAAGSALGVADFGGAERPPSLANELGGFVVTLVTGGILMTAAACLGWPIRWFVARRRKTRRTPAGGGLPGISGANPAAAGACGRSNVTVVS